MVGRGAAVADIDGDGDLDIIFSASGQSPRLLRNDQKSGYHWLRLRLKGTKSPRDAIGALVSLSIGGEKRTSRVMPTRSYMSQCERIVTFGLGATTKPPTLEITWPSGTKQTVKATAIDQRLDITEE